MLDFPVKATHDSDPSAPSPEGRVTEKPRSEVDAVRARVAAVAPGSSRSEAKTGVTESGAGRRGEAVVKPTERFRCPRGGH